jgi:hypothetical protein
MADKPMKPYGNDNQGDCPQHGSLGNYGSRRDKENGESMHQRNNHPAQPSPTPGNQSKPRRKPRSADTGGR